MKAYTDIEQSKKLAEILPLESADLYYTKVGDIKMPSNGYFGYKKFFQTYPENTPCWSLAALVAILPISCDDGQHCFALITPNPNDATEWLCCYEDSKGDLLNECYADNSIDACVDLILKLHELKLL